MCVWCNMYGRVHDGAMVDALGMESTDIITPSDVISAIMDRDVFERASEYWISKMTKHERARFDEEMDAWLPSWVETSGRGVTFVRNCGAMNMPKLTRVSWTELSNSEIVDSGICVPGSTADEVTIDGAKRVYVGAVKVFRPVPAL